MLPCLLSSNENEYKSTSTLSPMQVALPTALLPLPRLAPGVCTSEGKTPSKLPLENSQGIHRAFSVAFSGVLCRVAPRDPHGQQCPHVPRALMDSIRRPHARSQDPPDPQPQRKIRSSPSCSSSTLSCSAKTRNLKASSPCSHQLPLDQEHPHAHGIILPQRHLFFFKRKDTLKQRYSWCNNQKVSQGHLIIGIPCQVSLADTGNSRRSVDSWLTPYGITFLGKPAGRYPDGCVFTDYLASYLKIKSPIPYRWRKMGMKPLRHGMNFAYGGTTRPLDVSRFIFMMCS
ncbi:hypothetical protein IFM89_038565 [Coptis chinensis]|uniref:Uncharacterized protein n=1 Tax=Coptis chinensis TaxID=261450 RepID=A0A835LU00_9MAGN|nr:hypothetical protein IFM89_038565 [Coptis chinensis]